MEYKKQLKNVQNDNLNNVLLCLKEHDKLDCATIATMTNISIPSVHKYLDYLVKNNFVYILNSETVSKVGPKSYFYTLNKAYSHFLLISISKDTIRVKITDFAFKDLNQTKYNISYSSFNTKLINIIENTLKDHPNIHSIFISCIANITDGVINSWTHEEHLNGLNIEKTIEKKFNISCSFRSDIEVLSANSFSYFEKGDRNALIANVHEGEVSLASIINNELHIGLDYLNKYMAPTTFKLPNNKAYELILKIGISIIGPDLVLIYSNKEKKEALLNIKSELERFYPNGICPKISYRENYIEDIFKGLKALAIKNTKINYII